MESNFFQQPAEIMDVKAQRYVYKLCPKAVQLADQLLTLLNVNVGLHRRAQACDGAWADKQTFLLLTVHVRALPKLYTVKPFAVP